MEKNNDPFGKETEQDKDIIDLNDETSSSEDDIIDLSCHYEGVFWRPGLGRQCGKKHKSACE